MSYTTSEFNKVGDIVRDLLQKNVRCRNDDKYLTYLVMRHYTNIYINFEDFNKIPAFETIKRTRAKIQNQEKQFLPTDPKVITRRMIRQEDIKEWSIQH